MIILRFFFQFYLYTCLFTNLTEKHINCQVCQRSYSSKYALNKHLKVHDDLKGSKCDICLKVFISKSQLKTHYRTHTGEKPFACQICDNKFTQKHHLVQHQATHSEIKSFKSSICPEGRFFKTKSQLTNHMVYHYEPKFSCSHCGHKSYTSGDLKRHEQIHVKKYF